MKHRSPHRAPRSRRPSLCLALVGSIAFGLSATVQAKPARSYLTRAIADFARGRSDAALRALDKGIEVAADARLRGIMHRQRGIILSAQGKRHPAWMAFLQALDDAPGIALSGREHRGQTRALFDCAAALRPHLRMSDAETTRFQKAFAPRRWTCPSAQPPAPPPAVAAAPDAKAAPLPRLKPTAPALAPAAPSTLAPAERPPWALWAAGGTAVASTAAGAILGSLTLQQTRDADSTNNGRLATPTNIAWTTAGVSALATAAVYLFWPGYGRLSSAPAPRLDPATTAPQAIHLLKETTP